MTLPTSQGKPLEREAVVADPAWLRPTTKNVPAGTFFVVACEKFELGNGPSFGQLNLRSAAGELETDFRGLTNSTLVGRNDLIMMWRSIGFDSVAFAQCAFLFFGFRFDGYGGGWEGRGGPRPGATA